MFATEMPSATPGGKAGATATIETDVSDHERIARSAYTKLLFWTACPNKRCRRGKACLGDFEECSRLLGPQIPGEIKAWIQGAAKAYEANATREDVNRAGNEALERYLALERHYREQEEKANGAAAAVVDDSSQEAKAGPRLRFL